ncbi:MAG: TetR/AcrR family transcriptional regulator [Thermoleophilaceae bacterium]|nr:TetR/AcrR family transcriptional regulator [Thermoleophilaceae bacterium]
MPRLTRKQKQEHTRSCLMKSAARVFARRGLSGASIDEVAEDAGYTKGAFYANFKSKEELFLAMLDESFSERIAETDRAFATDESPPEQARRSAGEFARAVGSDPEKMRLGFEFASHATRNEAFREELLTRFATLRRRMETIYRRRAEQYGLEPTIPLERIVRMTIAMADGWKMWQLLEPEAVDEQMLEEMMEIFTTGYGVMSGALEVQAAQR